MQLETPLMFFGFFAINGVSTLNPKNTFEEENCMAQRGLIYLYGHFYIGMLFLL
jgi:hypothetical protein